MKPADLAELVLLAAIWGSSFLFMRMGAGVFGAVPLSWLRVTGALLLLLPLIAWRRELSSLRTHWKAIFIVGVTNSAIPFACYAYASLSISAGLSAIFNAGAPLFGAVIARLWLNERLTLPRVIGLVIGFIGVFGLALSKASFQGPAQGGNAGLAVLACLVGTIAYGFAANFTKQRLAGAPPMAVAAGSQVAATLVLAPPAAWLWPAVTPQASAWGPVLALALLCTGLAYVMYFRLIKNVGPANAITVTFLVPAFAVAWGAIFLAEQPTLTMLIGCAVILFGTSLATGLWPRGARTPASRGAAQVASGAK